MANRFKTLGGLKLLLSQELSAVNQHQASCLRELRQLQAAVGDPEGPEEMLIEQAGQCGRCRCERGQDAVFGGTLLQAVEPRVLKLPGCQHSAQVLLPHTIMAHSMQTRCL